MLRSLPAFRRLGKVSFPKSTGININMMPYVMGDPHSLPTSCRPYVDLIDRCDLPKEEKGKIGYLSIQEGIVPKGTSQRRPGIHTEGHGKLSGGGWGTSWGGKIGGLYMASTVDSSCRIWNKRIDNPGVMGDCEHLRKSLGSASNLAGNELVWMTDDCPHESLPLPDTQTRQWFRLVTSKVDLWYSDHSTPNPLGVKPPQWVRIVHGNKFQ